MLRRLLNVVRKTPEIRPQREPYSLADLHFVPVRSEGQIIGPHSLPEEAFFGHTFSKVRGFVARAYFPSGYALQVVTADSPDLDIDLAGSRDDSQIVARSFERCRFDVTALLIFARERLHMIPSSLVPHVRTKEYSLHPVSGVIAQGPYIKNAGAEDVSVALNKLAGIRTLQIQNPLPEVMEAPRPTCYAPRYGAALVPAR